MYVLGSSGSVNRINVFDAECAERLRAPLQVDGTTWAEGRQWGFRV